MRVGRFLVRLGRLIGCLLMVDLFVEVGGSIKVQLSKAMIIHQTIVRLASDDD